MATPDRQRDITAGPLPEGAALLPLRVIPTEGGAVLHMLRADSPLYAGFGELYFSEVNPGAVRAWKLHTRQTQHFAVPRGRLKVVLYDGREGSATFALVREVVLGRPDDYRLLRIPTGVWYGFMALDGESALICNCADLPHDPAEGQKLPQTSPEIPYTW